MSQPRRAGGEFEWPPTAEDLEAIEVIEIWPRAADAPVAPTPAKRPAPPATAAPTEPPAAPAPAALPAGEAVQVLHLDARTGTEPFAIDLRVQSHGAGATPSGDTAQVVLDWPPRESDLDAITVVEVPPARIEPAPEVRPTAGATAVERPAGRLSPLDGGPATLHDEAALDRGSWVEVVTAARPADALVPARRAETLEPVRGRGARGRRWAWVMAGLAIALAGAAGWLRLERATSGRPPAAPSASETRAGTPASDDPEGLKSGAAQPQRGIVPLDPSVESVLADARQALASGDRLRSIDLATRYIAAVGREPGAIAVIQEALSSSRANVERQRRLAVERLGGAGGGDAIAAARQRQAMADEAWRAGEFGAAGRLFADAERAFARIQPTADAMPAAGESPVGPSTPAPGAVGAAPDGASAAAVGGVPADVGASDVLRAVAAPVAVAAPPPTVPALPPPAPAAESASPAPPTAEAAPSAAGVDAAVRRALQAYRTAYETLDARAAAAVYPSVDARALGRAFEELRAQKLDFERCDITSITGDQAQATCIGRLAFVPRIGSQTPRVEARRWTFALQREGDTWRIQRAQVGTR